MFKELVEKIAHSDQTLRKAAIIDELNRMGALWTIQTDGYINNILVSLNPSDRRLVVVAHWDSYTDAPGANDNGAACSILLKLIESHLDTDMSIDFLFTDKEEEGLLGSELYVETIGPENILGAINMEMCGMGDHVLVSCRERALERIGLGSFYEEPAEIAYCIPGADDRSFIDYDIPADTIIASTDNDVACYHGEKSFLESDFDKTMHTPGDTVDTINERVMTGIYRHLDKVLVEYGEG